MKTEVVANKGIVEIKRLCAQNGISPMELSRYLNVTWTRIYEIISGKRRITPETDVLLSSFVIFLKLNSDILQSCSWNMI